MKVAEKGATSCQTHNRKKSVENTNKKKSIGNSIYPMKEKPFAIDVEYNFASALAAHNVLVIVSDTSCSEKYGKLRYVSFLGLKELPCVFCSMINKIWLSATRVIGSQNQDFDFGFTT